ncbi:hypothetical protein ESCO_003163 [Escovopsis weberi]|uniref:peptidylprolyl isomerase n=1 Tax=Escovopsis weberi TaxID=150374 RepID=A0A0M8MZQ8_ESCWE|nr:hypothetical protein ESCO_003163 [Escovopsis weberi]
MEPKLSAAEQAMRDYDAEFERLNSLAEAEVEAEQTRIRNAFSDALRDAQKNGAYVDALSPEMIMARGSLPNGTSKGFCNGIFAGLMPNTQKTDRPTDQILYGFIFGAVAQLALGMGKVMTAAPAARTAAFRELVHDACFAAAASGTAVWLARKLEEWLVANTSKILAVLMNVEAAEKLAFQFTQNAINVSTTCSTFLQGAFLATTSLWHGSKSAWAKYNRDNATASLEWKKVKEALALDNLVRVFVSALSGAVIATTVAPAAGTGFLGFTVPCLVFFVSQWMLEHIITRKKTYGGWSGWLSSWLMEYQGAHVWTGGDFDFYEDRVTHQLKCSISLEVVVDPIRSIRTGVIYERAKLYAWLDERGTDPLTRRRTTKLDYIDAPMAKQHAARVAGFLGAFAFRSP